MLNKHRISPYGEAHGSNLRGSDTEAITNEIYLLITVHDSLFRLTTPDKQKYRVAIFFGGVNISKNLNPLISG